MELKAEGWIDLQVNGYQGVDFSSAGLTLDHIRKVVDTLSALGTAAFCPTIITSSEEVYRHNLPVLAEAMQVPELSGHLLGIHLEGPFISPMDGARGAHSKEHVRAPSLSFLKQLLEWAQDTISLVTLAPEMTGAMELIQYLSENRVTVSLGHHLAEGETIRTACQHGAAAITHLGNGIPNQLPRHPNPIWDQLAEERLAVMLIADGHHLPVSFLQVVFRARRPEDIIFVSDSAPIAGYPPGTYWNLGQQVNLEENGKLWNPRGNHLVGSSACLDQCVQHAFQALHLSQDHIFAVARKNALRLIRKFPKVMDKLENGISE